MTRVASGTPPPFYRSGATYDRIPPDVSKRIHRGSGGLERLHFRCFEAFRIIILARSTFVSVAFQHPLSGIQATLATKSKALALGLSSYNSVILLMYPTNMFLKGSLSRPFPEPTEKVPVRTDCSAVLSLPEAWWPFA